MFWKIFKTRKFWIVWLVVSIIGLFIGIFLNYIDNKELENSTKCNVNTYDNQKSIFIVTEKSKIKVYKKFHFEPTEFLPFPLKALKYNQEVYILDTLEGGDVMKIKYYSQVNSQGGVKAWNEAYIFRRYVEGCLKQPSSDK